MEKFSAGLALSTGLRMFARVVFRFFPVLLVLHAPVLFFHVQAMLAAPGLDQATASARAADWDWLLIVLDIPTTAILTHAIVRDLRGKRTRILESVAAGLRRTVPTLGVILLMYLVLLALSFAVGIPVGAAAKLDSSGVISMIFVIAMVVVMIAVYSRWFVAIPAIVIERPGPSGALVQSSELTEGRRLRIAGLIVLEYGVFLGILIAVHGGAFASEGGAAWYYDSSLTPWLATFNVVLFILFGVFRATMSAVTYYLVRTETEAQSPEQLAKIFD